MNKTKYLGLWYGLRGHPWRNLTYVFAAFSVLWTLTEGITHFLPSIRIEGGIALLLIILASMAFRCLSTLEAIQHSHHSTYN